MFIINIKPLAKNLFIYSIFQIFQFIVVNILLFIHNMKFLHIVVIFTTILNYCIGLEAMFRQNKMKPTLYKFLPGLSSDRLKTTLYNMLDTMKRYPKESLFLLMNEKPESINKRIKDMDFELLKNSDSFMKNSNVHSKDFKKQSLEIKNAYGRSFITKELFQNSETTRNTKNPKLTNKIKKRSTSSAGSGVLYLPINQAQIDPCQSEKGSSLLHALPLVFLSTMLSVADAAGNVMNNINNNNRINNNNQDNNINNDNINLAASINNANQINILPAGGRVLKFASAIMNTMGDTAISIYKTLTSSKNEKFNQPKNRNNNS